MNYVATGTKTRTISLLPKRAVLLWHQRLNPGLLRGNPEQYSCFNGATVIAPQVIKPGGHSEPWQCCRFSESPPARTDLEPSILGDNFTGLHLNEERLPPESANSTPQGSSDPGGATIGGKQHMPLYGATNGQEKWVPCLGCGVLAVSGRCLLAWFSPLPGRHPVPGSWRCRTRQSSLFAPPEYCCKEVQSATARQRGISPAATTRAPNGNGANARSSQISNTTRNY